jgi:alkanesulfonate monooxygenase SsuD/methylene tetrahydromethanopterin reductase-like flavin-dependent oxidoreductase (luciferase family)
VATDAATAREYAFGDGSPYRFYYDQLGYKLVRAGRANLFKPDADMPDEAVTTDHMLANLVIAGTVAEVVEQILAFRATVGEFGTLLYCGMDWADPTLARQSMELLAEQVMPAVNRALRHTTQTATTR